MKTPFLFSLHLLSHPIFTSRIYYPATLFIPFPLDMCLGFYLVQGCRFLWKKFVFGSAPILVSVMAFMTFHPRLLGQCENEWTNESKNKGTRKSMAYGSQSGFVQSD
ncbi:hypothetical protein BDV38DRAFT_116739 [Aspergillus pseudotamarii]|uniref:Uncharacterized protein n=1 Tax=Aspergillus pseudotamarii TaxID=132259 RepID=A0A5N6SND7_ASPPS|nr:uncharacterized protein BDV38DRAFT_116739 [Aspergillus pseudotamarii]KAE8136198.1 hypothetical protein BDV38DRAFT_116739 [Aspergillus pseudotamarii]